LSQPSQLVFQLYTDSGLYVPRIEGKGRYELQYLVIADGFPVARCTVSVTLDGVSPPTTITVR
jgi:hypothetical protein